MSDSRIQFPATASGASLAGTCLMHTIMFIGAFVLGAIFARPQSTWPCGNCDRSLRSGHALNGVCHLPDQRLKMSAALVPPNPKEFESAYSIEALRALFGT